jgi:uncharacterized protein
MVLSQIWIYPVKGLAGISVESAEVQLRGLAYDRRWMLTDETGVFLSQRELPMLALLGTAIEPPFLTVFSRKNPEQRIQIPLTAPAAGSPTRRVEVWGDPVDAHSCGAAIDEWFSQITGHFVHLVYMSDEGRRPVDQRFAPPGQLVSFADGFPLLLIGQASLDDLNSRLAEPLPMNRFRPNLVFTGAEPYAEDNLRDFFIGDVPLRGVKPCARCIVTTTNQDTGERGAEPLKTLAQYRLQGNKILFGQNVIWTGQEAGAVVRVGDRVRT